MILLDTHVLVWLYTGLLEHIPLAVQDRLNRESLGLSPFARLELAYMCEIGRVKDPIATVVDDLAARLQVFAVDESSAAVCVAAQSLTWTRDPFDRLLAAHAIASNLTLVTKDATLREHLRLAWWAE